MGATALQPSVYRPRGRVVPLALLSDESLAKLAGDGDDAAFDALFQRYRASLSRYCRSILRDTADAEDAFQNTMVSALRSLRREDLTGRVKPWLYRIAHNESISVIRRRRPEENLVENLPDDVTGGLDEGARERLAELFSDLGSLPEQQRSALVMRELVGLEYSEIGNALVISSVAARKAVYEARLTLGMLDAGRSSDCKEIRTCISEGDRRMLRSRRIRAHLRGCPQCSGFESSIRRRQHAFGLIPVLPVAHLMAGLGQGAAGTAAVGGGASAVGAGSTAGVTLKCLGICAVFAAAGSGFLAVGQLSPPSARSTPRTATPRSAGGRVSARPVGPVTRRRSGERLAAPHRVSTGFRGSATASSPVAPARPSVEPGRPSSPGAGSLPASSGGLSTAARSGKGGGLIAQAGQVVDRTLKGTVKTVSVVTSTAGETAGRVTHQAIDTASSAVNHLAADKALPGPVAGLLSGTKNLLK